MNNNLEEKLSELRNSYIKKLRNTFLSLKELLNEDPIDIQKIYSQVHTISGTSGMYGLKDLSNISTEFEIYLKDIKESADIANWPEVKDSFSTYLNNLEKYC